MIPPATPSLAPLVWQRTPGEPACCIQDVAVSADGETVMTGTYLAEGRRVARGSGSPFEATVLRAYCYRGDGSLRWSDAITAWAGVRCVAVSGDGFWTVAAGEYSEVPNQGFVRAYAAETGAVLMDHRTTEPVSAVAMSADGTWLVAAAGRLELFCRVQDTDGFTPVASYGAEGASDGAISRVQLSRDGTVILCGDRAGRVEVLHNSGGALVPMKRWQLPDGGGVRALAMAGEGQAFVVGGRGGEIWSFETANFLTGGEPSGHGVLDGEVRDVAIESAGRSFAVALNRGSGGGVDWFEGVGGELVRRSAWATEDAVQAVRLVGGGTGVALTMAAADRRRGAFQVWHGPKRAGGEAVLAWSQALQREAENCGGGPLVLATGGGRLIGGGGETGVYCFEI